MKCRYVFLLCVFVVVCAAEALITSNDQTSAVNQCANQTGTSKKTITKLTKKLQVPKNDPTLKPFLTCFFKQAGFQDESGAVLFEKIREQLGNDFAKADADKVVDKCKNHTGDSSEENAFLAAQCIIKNIKKLSRPAKNKGEK